MAAFKNVRQNIKASLLTLKLELFHVEFLMPPSLQTQGQFCWLLGNPLNTTPYVSKVKGIIQKFKHSINFMWTRAHVDTAGNEAADVYAKMSTEKDSIDCHLALAKSFIKHLLLQDTLQQWQACWNSLKGRAAFELCPVFNLKRLHGNCYINQLITGHGAKFSSKSIKQIYQAKFFP
ncbi:hypothetical protein CEXT_759841 [Caerostris extrusa]|uniref:RNase H type-1 domain-containing protein n=1 Tax=Caerostris extrusa TaxID=172846 RepID=A0AAV4MGS3_CAEEX|nr:hypothetical protein CEXT_759841 [Caerostris extrusa]